MKTDIILGYVTCPTLETARKIAQQLVTDKVVACVTLMRGVEAYYYWNDELCEDHEVILLAKLPKCNWEVFQEQVSKLHPYECPAILALPIVECSEPFAQWIKGCGLERGGA